MTFDSAKNEIVKVYIDGCDFKY